MADTEPLLFRTVLGNLRPLNGASEDAMKAIEIRNVKRERE